MKAKMLSPLILFFFYSTLSGQELLDLLNAANEKAQNGNCIEAIYAYDQILKLNPQFSNALAMKGLCYSLLGKNDSACICFVDGIGMDNTFSQKFFTKYCSKYEPVIEDDSYKTGTFLYLSNTFDSTAYVERDLVHQIEYAANGTLKSTFKIKWNSATSYTLKLEETNDSALDLIKKKGVIKVRVLKFSAEKLTYSIEINNLTGFGNQLRKNSL